MEPGDIQGSNLMKPSSQDAGESKMDVVDETDKEILGAEVDLRGTTLVKNMFFNILGIGVPSLVGFVTIPLIIKGLGLERFGILALIWVVTGYLGFIDLGLSRATTKYVAEALGAGRHDQIPEYVGTTMMLQGGLGLLGAASLILLTPLLVEKVLNIPGLYLAEVKASFIILAFSIPIILLSSSLRGVLEAAQRFDLVNAVKIPVSASFYVLPLIGLALGFGLPGILGLLIFARLISMLVWGWNYSKLFPHLPALFVFRRSLIRSLLSFGGWVSISSIVYTISNSIDRFMIGSLRTVRDVSYYSAPQEVVTKFGIIPGSLSLILFPAFSSLMGGRKDEHSRVLYVRSLKYIIMCTGPIVLFFVFYAGPFLRLWLGKDFSSNSGLIMQILSLGFLITSLSGVPFNYLQGTGKVALVTKLQIAELALFLPLAALMIKHWGIRGAAIALGIKTLFLTSALLIVSQRKRRIEMAVWRQTGFWRSPAANVMGAGLLFLCFLLGWRWVGAILVFPFLASVTFFWVLNPRERHVLAKVAAGMVLQLKRRKA
jgi:O-antigen/teichoic acid export membrane protein